MQKKTDVLSIRIDSNAHKRAMEIISRTGPGSLSRYLRSVIDDLIEKTDRGEKIAEPPQLLTLRQRRILERETEQA